MPKLADPVAISIFGLEIRWYAIFILTGLLIAIAIARWIALSRGLDPEFVLDVAPWIVIGALIGARLYYLALKWDYFLDQPREALNIRLGGLTVHGAIVGGLIALYVYCRWRDQRFLTWADIIAAAMPIGQAIGRWGNWANQEAFGTPTSRPWAVHIDPQYRPPQYSSFETFHPTFLYESLLNLAIAAILIPIALRMPLSRFWREGDVVWIYMILYGSVRFLIERVRTDSLYIGPLPAAYWISWGLIAIGVAMLLLRRTVWPGAVVADLEPVAIPTPDDQQKEHDARESI